MKFLLLFLFFFCYVYRVCCRNPMNAVEDGTVFLSNTEEVNFLIKTIVKHFKRINASMEPLPLPDPFHCPDDEYRTPFYTGMVRSTNVAIRGLSRLKMNNLNADLVAMKISFDLHLPILLETGHYSYLGIFNVISPQCSGKFSINITNGLWNCHGALEITKSGQLTVSRIELDLKHRDDMKIYVEDCGRISEIVNEFGEDIIKKLKTFVLSVINVNTENYLNEQLKNMRIVFPNSIPPIDTFTIEARKFVKNSKYDPYSIPEFLYTTNVILFQVSQIYIVGISSFHRTGNMSVSAHDGTFQIILNFGTGQLRGDFQWEFGILGMYSRTGSGFFGIDGVDVFLNVSQSLDLSKAPVICEVKMKVGGIQMMLDGDSIFEYGIEFFINLISNWLRNQVTKIFKTEIINEIQENIVNQINMEDIILEYLINDKSTRKI